MPRCAIYDFLKDYKADKSKPWLILGKGPTFSTVHEIDKSQYHCASINHTIREVSADICSIADYEVVEDCAEKILANAKILVMPYYPLVKHNMDLSKPLRKFCKENPVLQEMSSTGRLYAYNLRPWHPRRFSIVDRLFRFPNLRRYFHSLTGRIQDGSDIHEGVNSTSAGAGASRGRSGVIKGSLVDSGIKAARSFLNGIGWVHEKTFVGYQTMNIWLHHMESKVLRRWGIYGMVEDDSMPIHAAHYSSEIVLRLLAYSGIKMIRSLGIDGGFNLDKKFEDVSGRNPQVSYDLQWEGMTATIKEFGLDYQPLLKDISR